MLEILWLIFIAPIEFCMKAVFDGGYALTHSSGLALIGVSLVVNTAVLPIYNKAEAWQEEERTLKKRMAPKETMIRRCFRGQERFAMLSTLYRQFGYSPFMTLRASIGILLQIPFFLAAYLLLSNMTALDGVSFGPIRNLGAPDGLLSIGGVHINVLPILMTAINLFSAFFYTHGLSRRDKIQLYGMAGIFLVLLYNSPAGLTFYWTLNNIYSLCKNIVQKDWMKRPGWERAKQLLAGASDRLEEGLGRLWTLVLGLETPVFVLLGVIGAAACVMLGYGLVKHALPSLAMSGLLFVALAALGILGRHRFPPAGRLPAAEAVAILVGGLGLPYVLARYGLKQPSTPRLILGLLLVGGVVWALTLGKSVLQKALAYALEQKEDLGRLFLPAGGLMAFLVCVYFPFLVFSSDPLVFGMSLEDFAAHRLGTFFVVLVCLVMLSALARRARWLLGALFFVLALASLAFCFVVMPDVGVMDAFVFQHPEALEHWYNSVVDGAVFFAAFLLFSLAVYFGKSRLLTGLVYASLLLLVVMTGVHFSTAKGVLAAQKPKEAPVAASREVPEQVRDFFTFTRTGKNIVVVMLDCFTGGNMNQILERHPELRTELSGFTWYEDTVTSGQVTILGKPVILGGEDSHPINLNKDETKSLVEKINRSFAKLFGLLQARNFHISVFENEYFQPELLQTMVPGPLDLNFIKATYATQIWPGAIEAWEERSNFKSRKVENSHRFFDVIGLYNIAPLKFKKALYGGGNWRGTIDLRNWNIGHAATWLANLELPVYASTVTDKDRNSFIYVINLLVHPPWAVDEKGLPAPKGANNESIKFREGGLSEEHLRTEYFALKKLVDWFDWMKKNGVYDNTQIILVSDHGRVDSADLVKLWGARFYPACPHGLLLVKERDAHGDLVVDRDSQMANWDVPVLISNGLAGDDSEKTFPWKETPRPRRHTAPPGGKWDWPDHGTNTYDLKYIINIEGPLYRKESWKRERGNWPPDS